MTEFDLAEERSARVRREGTGRVGSTLDLRVGSGRVPARNAGYRYLEVKCLGCETHQTVALDIVRRPKWTPIHELERYMRCKQCPRLNGYLFKRSHLVALRTTKISTMNPPSTWWLGERQVNRRAPTLQAIES
ncbi:hypothetical protein [Bradyrhizobium sp. JR3.5]